MRNANYISTPIESRITEVTVYLSGAQVSREGKFTAGPETQRLVFKGLPYGLQPESIQVFSEKGVVIHSVEHQVNYQQQAERTEAVQNLQKELEDLNGQLLRKNNTIELGQLEENFFTQNMQLAGTESGLKADELKAAVLFYNERMAAIRETRIECSQQIEELDKKIYAIKSQLGEFDRKRPEPVSEVTVTVSADEEAAKNSPEKTLSLS
ncbi:MAG: DUF4140 domain-containing protein, partial [Clostridiales bacterium]|nr:DUF4140 domain-containing protein [Clostridiales bacterium]